MSNDAIRDLDSLMDASMDDIDDLPPVGVPPSGHYNLLVTAERKENKEKTSEYIQFSYEVEAINEVKDSAEEAQAAVGMKFSQMFSPIKKDGTINEFGIGFLKEAVAPFSAHFGTTKMGDTIAQINKISVAASLTRRVDKRDADRFNFNLKDVVIL
jgi:hypothetical protein